MERNNFTSNRELVLEFFDKFEKGLRNEAEGLWSSDYQLHFPGSPVPLDRSESKQRMKLFNVAFPDLKFKIDFQIHDGAYVITRFTMTGTHRGDFNTIPATNKKVSTSGIAIHRFNRDKIIEEFVEFDGLGLLMQLGFFTEETKDIDELTEAIADY